MKIAHLSDPHVNLKYHPKHLPRLRRTLEDALERGADHIVITGDITSNADTRDLRAARQLFESLGILSSNKLSIVVGNHDIFGGPHLAEELLAFPDTCKRTDYDERLAIFQDAFSELFTGTIVQDGGAYPFLKRVRKVCFLGVNTIARHGSIENAVGSNGKIRKHDQRLIDALAKDHAWQSATHRIVLMHHHLFRKRDVSHLHVADGASGTGILAMLEKGTLKLHGKSGIMKLFDTIGVDIVMHGHVHFTGDYSRSGILCLNSAGAVFPANDAHGRMYHMLSLKPTGREIEVHMTSRSKASSEEASVSIQYDPNSSIIFC